MNKRFGYALLTGLLVIGALIGLLLIGTMVLRQWLAQARADLAPPEVLITFPEDGVTVEAGSSLLVRATVLSSPASPVGDVEWWLDGTSLERETVSTAPGAYRAYVDYDLLVPGEGGHWLLVRAVNQRGAIGQSAPLFFEAVAKGEAFYSATLGEGETIEGLAAEYGTDAGTLQELNPGLIGGSAPPGTNVKIPVAPEAPVPPSATAPPTVNAVAVPTNPMLQPPGLIPGLAGLLTGTLPQAPANLRGDVKDCRVKLVWDDMAANESGYEIWQAAPGGPAVRVATLQPSPGGATWYEFAAPNPGPSLFWVVAINAVGGQPSTIVLVLDVDPKCPTVGTSQLQVDLRKLQADSPVDRLYCYVSFEKTPEIRMPPADGDFISVKSGQGDLAPWPHAFGLPLPVDGSLEISGECWGWSGASLSKLGTFSTALGKEKWDGTENLLDGGTFKLSLTAEAQSATGPGSTTNISGPTLPIPYEVKDDSGPGSGWAALVPWTPRSRHITWKWDGDLSQIDEFIVFLNGSPIRHVSAYGLKVFEAAHFLDRGCGQDLEWQVAVRSGTMLSALSPAAKIHLPDCQVFVRVQFLELTATCTAEGASSCMSANTVPCDTLDAYYELSVNDETRSFWGGNVFIPFACGAHAFTALGAWYEANQIYPSADTFVLPVASEPIEIRLRARMWDHDSGVGNGDDLITSISRDYWFPSLENALSSLEGSVTSDCVAEIETGFQQNGTAITLANYSIEVFPNSCRDSP